MTTATLRTCPDCGATWMHRHSCVPRLHLQEARISYAWARALDEQAALLSAPRRPWWWWLALVAYLGFMAGGFWIVYRAFAGWPTGYSWLQRLAG